MDAEGFAFAVRKNGEVIVTHHGRAAATLRGPAASRFLGSLDKEDAQALMARVTGNYRRGNERAARGHSRNAGQ